MEVAKSKGFYPLNRLFSQGVVRGMEELSFARRLAVVLTVFTAGALILGPLLLRGWTLPNITLSLFVEGALLLILGAMYAFQVGDFGVARGYYYNPPVSGEAQAQTASNHRQQQSTSVMLIVAGLIVLAVTAVCSILQLLLV